MGHGACAPAYLRKETNVIFPKEVTIENILNAVRGKFGGAGDRHIGVFSGLTSIGITDESNGGGKLSFIVNFYGVEIDNDENVYRKQCFEGKMGLPFKLAP